MYINILHLTNEPSPQISTDMWRSRQSTNILHINLCCPETQCHMSLRRLDAEHCTKEDCSDARDMHTIPCHLYDGLGRNREVNPRGV